MFFLLALSRIVLFEIENKMVNKPISMLVETNIESFSNVSRKWKLITLSVGNIPVDGEECK